MNEIDKEVVERIFKKLDKQAESAGYHLNPDIDFTKELIKGLLVNGKRYGYWACPWRLADGVMEKDLDIICPCDYRDPDLSDFGTCYCALYVSQDILDGKKELDPIVDRRPPKEERKEMKQVGDVTSNLSKPVWRCKVCGYLCARDEPPEVCPICKVTKDRFELFIK